MTTDLEARPIEARVADPPTTPVHLVLRRDWPVALCGHVVGNLLGTSAPGRDRCVACLKVAAARGLGHPGWRAGA